MPQPHSAMISPSLSRIGCELLMTWVLGLTKGLSGALLLAERSVTMRISEESPLLLRRARYIYQPLCPGKSSSEK